MTHRLGVRAVKTMIIERDASLSDNPGKPREDASERLPKKMPRLGLGACQGIYGIG
jgi:hypothetical protein